MTSICLNLWYTLYIIVWNIKVLYWAYKRDLFSSEPMTFCSEGGEKNNTRLWLKGWWIENNSTSVGQLPRWCVAYRISNLLPHRHCPELSNSIAVRHLMTAALKNKQKKMGVKWEALEKGEFHFKLRNEKLWGCCEITPGWWSRPEISKCLSPVINWG